MIRIHLQILMCLLQDSRVNRSQLWVIVRLYEYYVKHPDRLPEFYKNNCESEGVQQSVCDFVSGMTDRYAIEVYSELYVPKVWRGTHI